MKKLYVGREEKDLRFKKASQVIDDVLEDPGRFPDKAVILLWSDEELSSIFTKERLRLLRKVKGKSYDSFSELAEELDRDVSQVRKDVKLLEDYGLVTLERHGNKVKIYSDAQGVYVPLERARPLEEYVEEITA
jgi:predicted transcriptional regulator